MVNRSDRLNVPGMIVAGCLVAAGGARAAEFRAGVAAVDITPPMGVPMAGYYHERGADGVLDPLFSKALVMESGGTKVALVALDLISIPREVTDRARAEIEKKAGIPGDHVMISATHAHTGPELAEPGQYSEAMGGRKPLAVQYTESLPGHIAASVQRAAEALGPARPLIASGRCEGLAFNRRYFMRDGSVGWNPGRLNRDIMLPAGPIDPEVGLLYLEKVDPAGSTQPLATYVNFAMHPDTTGGSKVSADWPGALARVLAGYHGPGHATLLANGTCGNINHLDFQRPWPVSGVSEQNRIGTILGAAVFQAYKELKPLPAAAFQARSVRVELPLPEITPAELDAAKKAIEATPNDHGANFMKLVRAYRVVDIAARNGRPFEVEVQALAMGGHAAWVSLPGEVFVELGLAIKKRSPFAQTYVVELANENIGYIPDRRSFAEGNYEPESARCAVGSGEKLVDAAVDLLQQLHQAGAVAAGR